MGECRRRSTGRRRSDVAGIQNEHACTASAHGHIRSAIGSASDRDQRLVARWGRRIGGLRRDGAVVFDETNADGAARDLYAAGRTEAGQRDHGRFAVLCKTVWNGECGIAPGVDIHALGQGLDECLTGLVDGLLVGIVAGLPDGLFQRLVEVSTDQALPTNADTPDGLSDLARDAAVSSRISRYRAVAIIGFAGASPRAS